MNKKKIFFIIVSLLFLLSIFLSWQFKSKKNFEAPPKVAIEEKQRENVDAQVPSEKENSKEQTQVSKNYNVFNNVPFTSQAPTGNWKDMTFEDGCEEASIIMAMAWANNKVLPEPKDVENQIRKVTQFEQKIFGDVYDTSVFDTARIVKEYFNYPNVEVRENITLDDIKSELVNGKLVIVPTFGRALHNPNYTALGPITHMLVITGYDNKSQEFITNDSGTKRGKDYRYPETVLFNAIWEYPTGKNNGTVPTEQDLKKKAMIIISKK